MIIQQVRAVRTLGRKIQTDANMGADEVLRRLNRMCVELLKRSAVEANSAEYMFQPEVAKVKAEEYRKDATAINLAALAVDIDIRKADK